MNKTNTSKQIKEILKAYNLLVKGIEAKANEDEYRTYGGIIRSSKGLMVENIGEHLVRIAWQGLGGKSDRLSLEKQTVRIPLNQQYLARIRSREVVEYIKQNIQDYYYTLKTDIHTYINNEFVIAIECKSFTENAMVKRILVDFTLFKQVFPNLKFVLLQLESQLTGDYSQPSKKITYGSPSTHTLLSYFDIDINIITLLEGERKVDEPIHKPKFYKELKKKNLVRAIDIFKELLKDKL
ncbi:restriction endonuclease [bacterium Unc6]|nr:restriction endonuclease [bacterium Unc6]